VTPEFVNDLVEKARVKARARVAALRALHPKEDEVDLGRRLIKSAATRAGLWGAATGTVALVALPIGLPAGVAAMLAVEAGLIFALLDLYGVDTEGEQGRLRLYALWLRAGFAYAAKSAGMNLGARALGKVLWESLPGQLIRRINPILLKAILKRLGLGWLPRAFKLWPILGAPIAFAIDRAAGKTLGDAALATLDDEARVERRRSSGARAHRS